MALKDMISKDIWEVIKDNYERGSYTTAINNLVHYINEVVQERSGLENVDNTSLIEQAFFKRPPALKINKCQTKIEKDIQEGVGHLLKGACLAIRNPRSHKRYTDDKLTADRIILFYDYVMEFVRKSEQPNLIEDWLAFVFDINFTNTKQYAETLLKEIHQKKKYDLLVNIFRNREKVQANKLNYLVSELLNQISENEYKEFMDGVNKDLLHSCADDNLRMFFNLFPTEKWKEIMPLAKLRVEEIIKQSIEKAEAIYEDYSYGTYVFDGICEDGKPAIWAFEFIDKFENKEDIIWTINSKKNENEDLAKEYFKKYFSKYIDDNWLPF